MTVLTDEAAAQYQARVDAEAAALDEARKQLRQDALDAVRGVLVREDGTVLTLSDAGLATVLVDLDTGLVVVSDDTVSLAASKRDDRWVVRLVENQDGWTPISDRVRSLADIGAALAAEGV